MYCYYFFFFLQMRYAFHPSDFHRSTSKTQLTSRNSYSNIYCLCLLCGHRLSIKTSPQQQIISW